MRPVLTVLLFSFLFIQGNNERRQKQICISKASDHLASLTEKNLRDALIYKMDKDQMALKKSIDSGKVFILKQGIKVHILDDLTWSVKYRVIDETVVYWAEAGSFNCSSK